MRSSGPLDRAARAKVVSLSRNRRVRGVLYRRLDGLHLAGCCSTAVLCHRSAGLLALDYTPVKTNSNLRLVVAVVIRGISGWRICNNLRRRWWPLMFGGFLR